MSSHSEPRIYAFKADAAVAAYLIVKGGTDKDHVAKATAATDKLIGIQQNESTTAEDKVEVAIAGGGAKLKIADTVAVGDRLTADSAGKGVVTTSNADKIIAIAMQDGVTGDVIGVEVVPSTL